MDWITGIQRALDYIEAHLTDDIDYEAAAREAASSSFHFQRMFSMLVGYTLGDYIRMRRLSLAADELHHTDKKIIDIALILEGGNIMDYKIKKRDAFKIICRKKQVHKPQGDAATADISKFWAECNADGTMERLCEYASFEHLHGILGICFSDELSDSAFPYGIGAEYNGKPITDDRFEIAEIPAYTYAVFQCRGIMPDAFKETYRKICTEFFPQSSTYEYGSGIELEVYPSADVQNPDYVCEIWIAVNEKK